MRYVCTYGSLVALALVGAFASAESGIDSTSDPTGTWRLDYDWQGEPWTDIYEFKLDERGGLIGSLTRNEERFEIEQGTFKDGALSFSVALPGPGDITARYQGKIRDRSIEGSVDLSISGQSMNLPWAPRRVPGAAEVIGNWELSIQSGDGNTYQILLKLRQSDQTLTGTYVPVGAESTPLTDVKVDRGRLQFKTSTDYYGTTIGLAFDAKILDRSIEGSVAWQLQGQSGESPFTGKLKSPVDR